MKFSFYKSDMLDALKLVARSVAVKPTTPILAGIYLKAEGSTLEMQSNDFATGTIARIPVNTEVPGEVVIPGKDFHEIIARQPDDTVTAELIDNQLELRSGAAKFALPLLGDVADFPTVQKPEGKSLAIKANLLKEIITKTAFAVMKDDSRQIFKGIYFEIGNGEIKATSTNTHRLAHFKAAMPTEGEVKAIVPALSLKNLALILPSNDNDTVTVTLGDKFAAFMVDNYLMTVRIPAGEYPPYGKLISKSPDNFTIKANRLELKGALDRMLCIAKSSEYNNVALSIDKDTLTLSARDNNRNKYAEETLQVEGNDYLQISFNIAYLTDFVNQADGDALEISFSGQYAPSLWQVEGDENYLYVVTPVRT